MFWTEISKKVGFNSQITCIEHVHRYVKKHKLPKPPKPMTKGEMAYEDFRDEQSWDEVRKIQNEQGQHIVRNYAYGWSKRNKMPWPPPPRDTEECDYTNAMKTRLDEP